MSPRHFRPLALLALALTASACQEEMPRAYVEPPADSIRSTGLSGYWRWVSSKAGEEITRPVAPEDSLVFRLGAYGGYGERAGDRTLTTRYWFAEGRLYQGQDTAYTVLLMDSSFFFRLSVENEYHGVAVRKFDGRTLLLSGTGTDATLHTFTRVVPVEGTDASE